MADLTVAALRKEWGADWRIWRSHRHSDDLAGGPTGDYVATCLNPRAGIDATVMADTLDDLVEALRKQKAKVDGGEKPPSLGPLKEGQ